MKAYFFRLFFIFSDVCVFYLMFCPYENRIDIYDVALAIYNVMIINGKFKDNFEFKMQKLRKYHVKINV